MYPTVLGAKNQNTSVSQGNHSLQRMHVLQRALAHGIGKLTSSILGVQRYALHLDKGTGLISITREKIESPTTVGNFRFGLDVGIPCETGDLLTPKPGDAEVPVARRFHATPRVGDILVVEGAGAYCSSMAAKNYNSFPEAAEVMLLGEADSEGSRLRLIRKRQTLSQMTENEVELDVDFAKLK